jgi:type I restriction enzyme S subunit
VKTDQTPRLPTCWCLVTIGEIIFEAYNGRTFKSSEWKPSGIPIIRIENLKDRRAPFNYFQGFVSEQHRVNHGDLLFAWSGTPGTSFGAHLWQGGAAALNQHIFKIRFDRRYLNAEFLRHALNQNINAYVEQAQGGVGLAHITKSKFMASRIPLAPQREQIRVVQAIDSYSTRLDAAVATLYRVRAGLKRYRASVLKAAVEGQLVPTEAELARKEGRDYEPASVLLERILKERRRRWEEGELGKLTATGKPPEDDRWKMRYAEPGPPDTSGLPELPEGWCWTSIEQLASDLPRAIQSGPFGSSLLHSEFQKTGKLVVGIDNVQDGVFSKGAEHRISEEKYAALEKYRARPGDVLITVMATVGRCCIVPDDLEPAIITKHVYRITPNHRLVASGYLFICLWGGPAVRRQMFGQVRGQTRPGLNGTIIKRLSLPLPPLREQQRILEAVDMHMSEAAALHSAVRTNVLRCQRLRQSILKWAFEGKLVDHDPTDEPSSVLLERIKAERQKTGAEAVRKAGGSRNRETA